MPSNANDWLVGNNVLFGQVEKHHHHRKKCLEKPHYTVVIMANESWSATDSFRLIKSGSAARQSKYCRGCPFSAL